MVGSTPTTCSSKRQTTVQTSTFGAKFTVPKKAVEDSFMLLYHLRLIGINVSKPKAVFMDNVSVVLNAENTGSTLNKKTVALSYHFVREHVSIFLWK